MMRIGTLSCIIYLSAISLFAQADSTKAPAKKEKKATVVPVKPASKEEKKATAVPAKPASKKEKKATAVPAKPASKEKKKATAVPAKPASKKEKKATAVPAKPASEEEKKATAVPAKPASKEKKKTTATPAKPASKEEKKTTAVPAKPASKEEKKDTAVTAKPALKGEKDSTEVPAKPASKEKKKTTTRPKKPTLRDWVKKILRSKEEEAALDSAQVVSQEVSKSPYEIMKDQNKEVIPLIIMRPVSVYGVSKLKDEWLLHLFETYMHFRLGGVPALHIVSPDTLSVLLMHYKEYKQAIPVKDYKEVAKKLSVPYILYLQCEYNPLISEGSISVGKGVNFLGKVSSVDDDRAITTISKQFSLKDLGTTLDEFTIQIVEEMGIEPAKQNRPFLESSLMSKKGKNLKKLGLSLSTVNTVDKKLFQKFLKKYNALLKKDPEMIMGYYAGAKFCSAKKEYTAAIDFANALIHKLGKKYPPAYLMTAGYYHSIKNYDEAIRIAELAKDLEKIQNPLRVLLAQCYTAKGNFKKAAELYEEILKHDPKNTDALLLFARKYNKEGKATEALSFAERFLAIDPNNQQGLLEKGKSLITLNKLTEALKPLEQVLSGIRPDPIVYELTGDVYKQKKDYPKAINAYSQCFSLKPKNDGVLLKLANTQIEAKKYKDAAKSYEGLFKLNSKKYGTHMVEAGLLLEKEKDLVGAKAVYVQFLEKGLTDDRVNIKLAQIEFSEQGYKKTISLLTGVKKDTLTTEHKMMLGVSYHKTGKGKQAVPYLEEVLKKDPKNVKAVEMLALIYDKKGDFKQAIALYEKYLSFPKTKQHKKYAFRIAKLYEKQKQPKIAVTRYTKNIKVYPDEIRNYKALSLLYIEQKSYPSAQKILEKAVTLPKAKPAVSKMLAKVYVINKDTLSAIQHYRKYLKSSPNDSVVWRELANFYFAKGNYAEAAKSIENAGKLKDENPDYRYKLGFSYYKVGKYDKAVPYLEEVRVKKGEDTEVLTMLADCYKALKNKRKYTEVMNILSPPEPEVVKPAKEPDKVVADAKEVQEAKKELKAEEVQEPEEVKKEEEVQKAEVTKKVKKKKKVEKKAAVPPPVTLKTEAPAIPAVQPVFPAVGDVPEDPLVEEGRILVLKGDYVKAKDFFMKMLLNNKASSEMLYWMFKAYALSDNVNEGEKLFLNNLREPNSVWALITLGEINEIKSFYDAALEKYYKAFEAAPANLYAILGIARIEFRNGNYESALEYYSKAFAFDQENMLYCLNLGKCYEGLEQYENALGLYDEVLTKSSEFSEAFDCAGRVYIKMGLHTNAIDTYKKGIKLYPEYGTFYVGLGTGYKMAGETDNAVVNLQKALKMGKQFNTIEAYRHLGEIYYQRVDGKKSAGKFFKKYIRAGGSRDKVAEFKAAEGEKARERQSAEEARIAEEEARMAEETQKAEEERRAEEARKSEETKKAAKAKKKAPKKKKKAVKIQEVETEEKKESTSTAVPYSVADELKKFADLRDAGVITEEEFQEQKKRLLSQ